MTMNITAETKDIKLSLPVTLWEELQKLIPQWQQSQFWVELLNRELRRIRFEEAWRGQQAHGQMKLILIWQQQRILMPMSVVYVKRV